MRVKVDKEWLDFDSAVGKTIKKITKPYDETLVMEFTDGSCLCLWAKIEQYEDVADIVVDAMNELYPEQLKALGWEG